MNSCPPLAQSGHTELHCTCPLSGVKRTFEGCGQVPLPAALPLFATFLGVLGLLVVQEAKARHRVLIRISAGSFVHVKRHVDHGPTEEILFSLLT